MSLQQMFEDWAHSAGHALTVPDTDHGYPCDPRREAFYAGAAAMAELFAAGQGPVLEELKALRTQMQEHAHMIADAAAHD